MSNIHSLGQLILLGGITLALLSAVSAFLGRTRKDARLIRAAEWGGLSLMGLMITASLLLAHAFLSHDYLNKYVAHYSDNSMPWYYLLASFWGGQEGSLLFWSLMLSICTGVAIFQNRDQNRELMPSVIIVLMGIQIFFLSLMVVEANPFAVFRVEAPPLNGRGLEPLLQNPAMTFHPPSILAGYVWFSVPFAFAIAALIHRRLDDAWIRTTRRYVIFSWALLSVGNLFGGMWAYEELGWGGFWGWDPVENASLMPWLSATAYLHSVMIQERRGMLKIWNIVLVLLTYFLTIFGTFLTRSGLIDSVHTFARSEVGGWFLVFLVVLILLSLGLLFWRVLDGSLRSRADIDSFLSREGSFLLNNMVLVAAVGVVMFGTLGQKISAYFWEESKYAAPWFNTWMTPAGLSLLLLMAVGPLLPWRRSSWKSFRKNLMFPILLSSLGTLTLYSFDLYHLQEHLAQTHIPWGGPMGRLALDAELTGVYALLGFWGVQMVFITLIWEFVRGTRLRARSSGESLFTALIRLSMKNRRRYGGYLTHLGFAGLFLGFIGTGLKTTRDLIFEAPGVSRELEGYTLTFKGIEFQEGPEYGAWSGRFLLEEGGQRLGELRPSRRNYTGANVRMSRVTTEKDERLGFLGNVYVTLISFQENSAEITAHYNPMIFWMWLGGGVLLLGVLVALWPEPRSYRVLAAARRRRG